ncbi:acyltransferase [Christiangramia marina]|uniref:acyltransferase n=1 Tax=Christiangramia marina TaxID=409436 RepID=UPI003AA99F99
MVNRLLNFYRKTFWSPLRYAHYLGVNIGDECVIGTKYFGSEPYLITIGNHVQITKDVRFFTHGGGWVFRKKYPLMDTFGKISIGNNVYIGSCALILPGVKIGDNVVIGAGTVVTKSVTQNSIVAGNPAKVVGDVRNLKDKMVQLNLQSKGMDYESKKKFLLSLSEEKFIQK